MMLRSFALASLLALPLAACVDEDPTNVGDALLPSGDVITFEVLLPGASFLVTDTAFSGYVRPVEANFGVVANAFEGVVDANMLLRYSLPPATIAVRGATGQVIDSFPRFAGGSVVFRFDTLRSTERPVRLRLVRPAEEWDASATWTHRVDTAGVRLPWATPGGTRGAQIDTATWVAGDSVVFSVDSATLAVWNDSTSRVRGALLLSETANSRIRVSGSTVHVNARSSIQADTVVNVDLVPTVRTFVFNPALPNTFSAIRTGGIPAWRTIVRFRPDLRTLTFPCTGGPAGCQVSLDSVHINAAQLLLQPAATPAGFVPEDSMFIEARTLSTSPQVPIERSPLGTRIALSALVPPDLFANPAGAEPVRLDITPFLVHLLDESVSEENRLPPLLSILQIPEAQTFGFASFEAAPTLRLVLTTALQRQP